MEIANCKNETDIREVIVRPFLEKLGYKLGTPNNIITEKRLRYNKNQLGRRSNRDPIIEGVVDYICEVVSFGRFVVEVKAPNEKIDEQVLAQTYSYAIHYEVAALYYLITNGTEFKVYKTAIKNMPILEWSIKNLSELFADDIMVKVSNILSPKSIRNLINPIESDKGKPLGKGLTSCVEIISGNIKYVENKSNHTFLKADILNGKTNRILGGICERNNKGQIIANIEIDSIYPNLKELNELLGFTNLSFISNEEYISSNPNVPTIFQNFIKSELHVGTPYKNYNPLKEDLILPFGAIIKTYTNAFISYDNDRIVGGIELQYQYLITDYSNEIKNLPSIPNIGEIIEIYSFAEFDMRIKLI